MIHDPPRTYKDPVKIAALALWRSRALRSEPRLRRLEPDAKDRPTEPLAIVATDAMSMLEALDKSGFLSPLYYDAMKAHRKGRKK